MRLLESPARASLIASVVGLAVALTSAPALAVGEEITDVRVLGNQRLTSGGIVKRSKPKQKSVKKSRSE